MPNAPQDPTADYRKYPKGPNFLGIVIAASIIMVLLFVGAWLVIRAKGRSLEPHPPSSTPNSMLLPTPGPSLARG